MVPITDILYAVLFEKLDERTADGIARAMVEYRYLQRGPAMYLAGIEKALSTDVVLTDALPTQHQEADFRAFLAKVRDRLLAMRPWPEPRFRKLPVSEWHTFRDTHPVAKLPHIHFSTVEDRLPTMFDDVQLGEEKLPVLVLRLGTGETVALIGSTDRKARGVLLIPRDSGDPADIISHFSELTGFSPEEVVPIEEPR
jgi:hypothetical protein